MKINEINAKGIITKSNLPDAEYVINPYVGCQHGCIYCYADFMRRFTGHAGDIWGDFIDVKINSAGLIRIDRQSYCKKKILVGSVTDAYQPIEAKYKLTRNILLQLVRQQPSIEILTKSRLVTRDIDVLRKYEDATVGISLSTLDENCSNILEPLAALPRLRLEALNKCHGAGLTTYLFISPIFPYITEIKEMIEAAAPYVDYFMFENLNVRPNNKKKIFDFISKCKPELMEAYHEIYDSKSNKYWLDLENTIKVLCKKHEKEARIYFHHGGFKEK